VRPRELLLAPGAVWDLDEDAASTDFAAWCLAHPATACRINVSSELVTELSVDPELPLEDDAAVLDWARVQLRSHAAMDGDAARDCAVWRAGDACGVSVLHGVRVPALQAMAAAAGVHIGVVRPWWSRVLWRVVGRVPALRRGPATLVVAEGARIAAVDLRDGRVERVQTTYLDAADAGALADWAQSRSADVTVATGFGLASGPAGTVEMLPGLHAERPGTAWREVLR
jgi:hypothetical protein